MCLNIGTPKIINFPFETNGKLLILDVPILKHYRIEIHFLLFQAGCQYHPPLDNIVGISQLLILRMELLLFSGKL